MPQRASRRAYTYLGDRLTDPALVGRRCVAVVNEHGQCITGRSTMLVAFDGEDAPRVVQRKMLRRLPAPVYGFQPLPPEERAARLSRTEKHCRQCNTTKPIAEFHRDPRSADQREGRCKACRDAGLVGGALYPVRRAAGAAVRYAVRMGRLAKPDRCDECGRSGHIEGHHDDYSKPLEVRWLCKPCHFVADEARRAREERAA